MGATGHVTVVQLPMSETIEADVLSLRKRHGVAWENQGEAAYFEASSDQGDTENDALEEYSRKAGSATCVFLLKKLRLLKAAAVAGPTEATRTKKRARWAPEIDDLNTT